MVASLRMTYGLLLLPGWLLILTDSLSSDNSPRFVTSSVRRHLQLLHTLYVAFIVSGRKEAASALLLLI